MNNNKDLKSWLKKPDNINSHLPKEIVIESFLEDGGQGVVFKGTVNQKPAAIKIYLPIGQLYERVQREITALRELNCPNIVNLLWYSQIKFDGYELPVVATSFVFGETLDKLIVSKSFDHKQLGILAYDVTNAIHCMWEKRIVHRDLKPSNIIIMDDGHPCVIDLGIARHIDQSTLTAVGATWGTYGYMSPEQVRAVRQLTCKSDLYSLGIILIECAMGQHITNRDQLRLMSMNLQERKNLPREIANWEYSSIVNNLLHPRPTRRPQPLNILELLSCYAIN